MTTEPKEQPPLGGDKVCVTCHETKYCRYYDGHGKPQCEECFEVRCSIVDDYHFNNPTFRHAIFLLEELRSRDPDILRNIALRFLEDGN